ncbi:hypothetical protein [Arthrobacter sp. NPDC093139]|uniref:hypothetical protein n=1 Tax=Arthrobacter sp. NPDC093139 TaxID=3363945 RepID=UPI0038095B93
MEPGDPHTESLFQGLPGIPRPGDPSLRGQVLDVIADIISGTTTSPDVRRRLLRQLVDNPGNPEQALLLHILDFEGP